VNAYPRRPRARRWYWWILLLLGGVLSGTSSAQEQRGITPLAVPAAERELLGFDAGSSTALFVGVRDFDDPALTSVPFAVDDAVDLAHLFAFDLALVTPRRVVLALSGEPEKDSSKAWLAELKGAGADVVPATQSKILLHLRRQSKVAGADGLFLVGLATHGFTTKAGDYLFARDTLRADPEVTGIPVPLLFKRLADASTLRRFALLDACKERLEAKRGTEAPPMDKTLHDAIAAARGQVVLAATTTNGYAYDDTERKNGVFTAAILDGLRGAALDKGAPFVTARTLADYVNGRVVEWVSQHRPADRQTLGITRNIQGAGATLPLAADAKAVERSRDYQVRKVKAINKLRDHLGGELKGETFDTVVAFLNVETPTDAHLDLLLEIEALDGTRRAKRRLAAYVKEYVSPLVHGAEAVPTPEPQAGPPHGGPRIPLPPPQTARLTVRSNVRGDTVYIDGEARGPTGPRAHELSPGTYTVRVEKPDYVPWERTLELAAGARETARAELVREVAAAPPAAVSEASPPAVAPPQAEGVSGPRAGEVWTEPVTGMAFVWVPEGCFQMGSEQGATEERPVHRVCVAGFWLARHEVTQGQWRRVMGDNPARFKKGDDYPVETVSWKDAQAFINRLNGKGQGGFRLPSEAQWEYACRSGGRDETYCGGDHVESLAWYWSNSGNTTHPVGGKRANGLGLYDMSGNVWEWVQDCYHESYEGAPDDGSVWEDGNCGRVIRGGSWLNLPDNVRSGNRYGYTPDFRSSDVGFRLARTP
jgi:formylglycine-generating enzyme required for sulfatase activity